MKKFNTTVMPIVAMMLGMALIAANAADPYHFRSLIAIQQCDEVMEEL